MRHQASTRIALGIAVAGLTAAGTGCIKQALINGQIQGTRQGSVAFDTIGDWDLAYKAAAAGIVQFEGMHELAPDNEDGLFMLVKSWTGYGFGFVEDDVEAAADARDRDLEAYHRDRAAKAYGRAIEYGNKLLARRAAGFEDAQKDESSIKAWLKKNFSSRDDAEALLWVGNAWMSRAGIVPDDPIAVAQLWIGVAMMERSAELAPDLEHYAGLVALASYHARTATAELDVSKQMFDEAMAKTGGKSVLVQFEYAARYACAKADGALYVKLMKEVLESPDSDPSLRLMNAVARHRARRWIGEKRMFDACSIEAPAAAMQPHPTPSPRLQPALELERDGALPVASL